jgi:hypothetical protein
LSEKDWDKGLPLIEFAYNTVEKVGHGYSPFKLTHSFDPAFPIDTLMKPALNSNDTHLRTYAIKSWRKERMEECQRIREFVQHTLKQEQSDRIKLYEKRLTRHGFEVGDLVWLYYELRNSGSLSRNDEDVSRNDTCVDRLNYEKNIRKLKNKWHGPFRILKRTGLKYEIDIPGNPDYSSSRIIPKVHHDRLKPAYSLFEFPPTSNFEELSIDDQFSKDFLPEDSWEEELLEDEFEVETIKGHRIREGELDGAGNSIVEYRVRWKGYKAKDDTWLETSELENCKDILEIYRCSDLYKHYEDLISPTL